MKKLLLVLTGSFSTLTLNVHTGEAPEYACCNHRKSSASVSSNNQEAESNSLQEELNPTLELHIDNKDSQKPHPLAFKAALQKVMIQHYPAAVQVKGAGILIECREGSATPDKVRLTLAVYQKALDDLPAREKSLPWKQTANQTIDTEWGKAVQLPGHPSISVTPFRKS